MTASVTVRSGRGPAGGRAGSRAGPGRAGGEGRAGEAGKVQVEGPEAGVKVLQGRACLLCVRPHHGLRPGPPREAPERGSHRREAPERGVSLTGGPRTGGLTGDTKSR